MLAIVSNVFEKFKRPLRRFSNLNCLSVSVSSDYEFKQKENGSDIAVEITEQIPCHNSPGESISVSSYCDYCGELHHDRKSCPARHVRCSYCKKPGHFRSVCKRLSSIRHNNHVLSLAAVNGPYSLLQSIIPVVLNGSIRLNALVDTGSTETYIETKIAHNLSLPITPNRATITLASSNSVLKSEYKARVSELEVQGFKYKNLNVSTLDGLCYDMIIGHDLLSQHGNLVVRFGGELRDFKINNDTRTNECPLLGNVCSLTMAKVEPTPLFSYLTEDCRPIACKSRRFGEDDLLFIRNEVSKLLSANVIEPCRSPWRAQVLITKDDRHKKRMVIDYSRTINKYTYLDAFPLPRLDDMAFEVSKSKIYSTFDLTSAYHQIPIPEKDRQYTAFEADGNLYQFTRIPFGVTNGVAAFQRVISGLIRDSNLDQTWAYLDNVTVGGSTQEEHDVNVAKFIEVITKHNLTLNHDKTIASVTEINMLGYSISHLNVKPDPERMEPLLKLPVPADHKTLKRTLGLFSYYSQWISKFSDKVKPLTGDVTFPLSATALSSFNQIKEEISQASLSCPNSSDILVVETDASDVALSAVLTQNGRPIAFFSRTLHEHERKHPAVEKEAAAIVEACRRWRHYLYSRKFKLLTDQQAVSFIFDNGRHGKTKNDKIERWRIEMSCYDFEIKFRPGVLNATADCLSRVVCSASSHSLDMLRKLHEGLVHPGIARMYNHVRSRNLPYSMEDVKSITAQCKTCAEIKPRFLKPKNQPLVKAMRPFDRLSVDFKGPISCSGPNKYMLVIIDEYSRFPFAYACKDTSSTSVIKHLGNLFSLFGLAGYVHSDNGTGFVSKELLDYLSSLGIPTSHSAVYNPRGNGQVERYNGIIWKGVKLALHSQNLSLHHWESVLPSVLHSIRTLLCTATNETPHERLFGFQRRTVSGASLPPWVQPNGKALVKKHIRSSKYDPWVEECEIVHATPSYAQIRTSSGKEQTVSLRDLAPLPNSDHVNPSPPDNLLPPESAIPIPMSVPQLSPDSNVTLPEASRSQTPNYSPSTHQHYPQPAISPPVITNPVPEAPKLRKSTRESAPVDRWGYEKLGG